MESIKSDTIFDISIQAKRGGNSIITANFKMATTYTIHEFSEKRGHSANETFKTLKEAISRLEVLKYVSARHGRIVKEAVKSFTWEWEDKYNTSFRTEIKILKDE